MKLLKLWLYSTADFVVWQVYYLPDNLFDSEKVRTSASCVWN